MIEVIQIGSTAWMFGWMTTTFVMWILKRKDFSILQLISRTVLAFFLWPFLVVMGAYFLARREL